MNTPWVFGLSALRGFLVLGAVAVPTGLRAAARPAPTAPAVVQAVPAVPPGPVVHPSPPPSALDPVRPLDLRLPTDNHALLDGHPETFFMGVDRTVEEKTSLVWEGGQFGFVRNPFKLGQETVFTRFHEGIDIAPTVRDNRGEPLDLVCAIAAGRVVFTNTQPRASNYGNYIVVEHACGYGCFYSLCAHLMRVDVQPGDLVTRGQALGRLGYTGSGLDRRRAHCHLEINLLLNERFEIWHQQIDPLHPSPPTAFHGFNLAGLDPAALYQALAADPHLTLPAFLAGREPYFKVLAPNSHGIPDLLRRYPWLWPAPHAATTRVECPSWEISFTASGLPLSIEPSDQAISCPTVIGVVPFAGKHSWKTMGRVGGTGTAAQLTPKGTEYINLITGAF